MEVIEVKDECRKLHHLNAMHYWALSYGIQRETGSQNAIHPGDWPSDRGIGGLCLRWHTESN